MVRFLFGKVRCCQGYRINGSCAPVNDSFAVVDCWVSLSCSGEGCFAGVGPYLWIGSTDEQSLHRSWLSIPRKKKASGKNFPMLFCVVVLFFSFLLCKNKRAIRSAAFLPTSYTSKHSSSDNVPVFQNPRRIIRSVSHSHLTTRKHPSMTI